MPEAPRMTIGGELIATDASFDVVNPATGKPFSAAPECTREQLDAAIDAAASAFGTWRNDEALLLQKMLECASAIEANVDALAAVPHDFRDVVVLVDLSDFSYADAARILDIPIGTVMSRLHRGRKQLQQRLFEFAQEHGFVRPTE